MDCADFGQRWTSFKPPEQLLFRIYCKTLVKFTVLHLFSFYDC